MLSPIIDASSEPGSSRGFSLLLLCNCAALALWDLTLRRLDHERQGWMMPICTVRNKFILD